MNARNVGLGLALGAGLALAPGAVGQTYSIQELPPLPGQTLSFGQGINDAGVVVGQTGTDGGLFNAARWVHGVPESLGTLTGYPLALALDINNNDQIVGRCSDAANVEEVPFIWENGVMATLPIPGYTGGRAERINDSGVAVGYVYAGFAQSQPCVWQSAGGQWTIRVLPTPGNAGGNAEHINNLGIVVGRQWGGSALSEACSWDSNLAPTVMSSVAVGPPNAAAAGAFGINDTGRMAAGYITAESVGMSELVGAGPTQPIGKLKGYAHLFIHSINNSGTVVGHGYNGSAYYPFPTFIDCRAIVWRSGTLSATNDLLSNGDGWDVRQTWDISQNGQIAGLGRLNGNYRALRLTPCDANCDGSSLSPLLNVNDFTCFLNRFAAADPYANCDQSTTIPVLNVNDFTCFLNKFAAGCP